MKKLLLAFAVIVIAANVNAQTDFEIAGNIGTGTKKGYTTTYGADLQVGFPATTGLKITGSAGYQNIHFKMDFGAPIGTVKDDFSFIPLMAGALFNLGSKFRGHAQLGYAFSTQDGGGGHFSYAPTLIYLLTSSLNLGLKYLSIDEYNAVMLRLAYNLGGSKK